MNTEEKIRQAALELFLEKGFERTSIRDIAGKANINIALMNYHFKNKENLFDSIFSELLQACTPSLNNILSSELPLEEKITEYVSKYIDILQENPRLTYFVLSVLQRNPEKIKKLQIFQSLYDTGNFASQFISAMKKRNISSYDPTQFYINMVSLITFPFTIKPVILEKNEMDEKDFNLFMQERKKIITDLLILSIKKK
ncbi:MAG TPA: TetR/AcrR family transcriptional regulator [Bacteroidales bacterium]|nr:TetR/AcrR family transcriptional regulator [Bacteroidales bacterium]HPI29061.1 TetR/AcrR family transcriptional regulator [Bacteroidales bacterium]HQP15433.1 TetR/AcrR family transcriptional regulator [Bacteroidales bacterium]